MFEKQKWSKALKDAAKDFAVRHVFGDTEDKLVDLIEMAMEEGFEDAKDTVNEWHDDNDREPMRDESRD